MNSDPLFWWGDLALLAGGPAILLFVGFYAARSRWESTSAGRSVMALAASLALLYVFIAVVVMFPEMPEWLRGVIRLVVYSLTSTAMWFLFINLLRHQRRSTNNRGSD